MTEPERLSLLAQAVAGRTLVVLAQSGSRAYTDGEVIHLPDQASDWERIAAVVVQAALLRAGSLDPATMRGLMGRRASRSRYLTLEAARALAGLEDVIPRWIAARLAEIYAGPIPADPSESLSWASESGRTVPEAPEWLGTLKPIMLLRAGPQTGGAPTEKDLAGPQPRLDVPELDDDDEMDRSRILEKLSAPLNNRFAAAMQKLLGMGRAPGDGSGGAEAPVGGVSFGPVGAEAQIARVPSPASARVAPKSTPFDRRYPEWDGRGRRYRLNWCAVSEFDPPPADELDALSLMDPSLRRRLARLGLRERRHRRQEAGDDIDIDALIERQVALAAGAGAATQIYETRRRTEHDLGVLVLLDSTGSTGESREGRSVFEEQRLLAARLTAAFTELGHRVATFGFYSRGRDAVRYLRVKDFDDHFDLAAQRRLVSLSPTGYTRLGAAIRHGTQMLSLRAGTAERLLVLVGDGLPYDDGYEHRYAQDDSARALAEAVAAGVGCVAVGVRTTTEREILERVWGEVPHVSIEDAGELSAHVEELFGFALRMAASSRRSTAASGSRQTW